MRQFSMKVKYDPKLDPTTWTGYNPLGAYQKMPEWKKDLAHEKGQKAKDKNRDKPSLERRRAERENIEREVEALIRKVVPALEMALYQLINTPAPGKYEKRVNQKKLFNLLVEMKTKCGVKFDRGDQSFTRKTPLDDEHQPPSREETRKEVERSRAEQRQARLAAAKATARHAADWINTRRKQNVEP